MKHKLSTPVSTILMAVALLAGGVAQAQTYGDLSQVLTVGVSQFRGVEGSPSFIDTGDLYLYNGMPGSNWHYLAPLALPEGALIEEICLYGNDSDTGDFTYVQASLVAVKLVPIGENPATLSIAGAAAMSGGSAGYGSWCSGPLSYTLRSTLDVEGDGILDAAVHYLALYMPHSLENQLGFGAARIRWKRQVTPAPSTPTFGDVPDTHPFFPFIEALAASGITGGCGFGVFCPEAALTRGQMAVFLAKAIGLHWTD